MAKKAKANWQEGDYFVQEILNSRFNSQKSNFLTIKECMQYKVKWVGYPKDQCTWQPHQHLQNVQDMIDKYMKEKRKRLKEGKLQQAQDESQQIQEKVFKNPQSQKLQISAKSYPQKSKSKNIQKQKISSVTRHKKEKTISMHQSSKQKDNQIQNQSISPQKNINNSLNAEQEIQRYISNNFTSTDRLGIEQQLSFNEKQFQQQHKIKPHLKKQLYNDNQNSFEEPGITASSAQDSFEILGMSRNKMDLLFHVCQKGAQKWVNRSQIIDKRAKQICEFYQQNLVFLRDQSEKDMID